MRMHMIGATTLLGLTLVVPGGAQELKGDQDILTKTLASQMAEIRLGEIAVKNASNAEVKRFAEQMITDHTKLRDALMERAKEHKLAVVQGLEKEHKEKVDRLSKLRGAEFDKEYMKIMVENHQKAMRTLPSFAKSAQDPQLRDLLTKALPTVEEHLKHAQQIAQNLK
jgi:putative membrane protein